ncbi:MAG: carbohydrate binding family 9 domain-containing protein [Planctomycetes bacterium]|nr:carbohydrate binding family 9 domain-containing protein [Planctomycetota bacterium]MCB9917834.1 carbohydrate binding family 9 domain-containing protein [Planctomycetota bacterium]
MELDGVVQEAVWGRAVELQEMAQVLPVELEHPSRATEVRLFYDADHLYIALRCFDDRRLVRARLGMRDANLDPDDRVEWWVDTFGESRFAYWFQIGAGGSRGDALISVGGDRFNKSWDGIWYGRSRVTDLGWEAEVAIPFRTMAFAKGVETWRFNVRRLRKENDEEMRWASPANAYSFFSLARGGSLYGIRDIRQGYGVDIVPYGKGTYRRDRAADSRNGRFDFGGDVYVRLTPELRAVLTYDTDFAETEVDARQVNLSRFPLFFPEKRDFFLADAGRFEFGIPSAGASAPIPFFSRRIGIGDNGDTIPILFGAKLAGSLNSWNIGALGIVTDERGDLESRDLGVVRVSKNVGEESSVGMIATGGRPTGDGSSYTFGADAKWGSNSFFGPGKSFYNYAYVLSTTSSTGGDGVAYGAESSYRDDAWRHRLRYLATGKDFDPALGFVRRVGQDEVSLASSYNWRGSGALRRYSIAFDAIYRTFDDGLVESWLLELDLLDIEWNSGDRVAVQVRRFFDRIPSAFDVGDLTIVPGDYDSTRLAATLESSDRRPLRVTLQANHGDLYGGTLREVRAGGIARFNSLIQVETGYSRYSLETPRGSFRTDLAQLRVDLNLTPELGVRNLLQYDTTSRNLSGQSRLRWIVEPGNELFLLGLYGWQRTGEGSMLPMTLDATVKVIWTLRF